MGFEMTQLVFLQDLVFILAAAVIVVALLRRLHVPAIAGFIVAGTIIGPHALGLVQDLHQVEILAELGVVLLMFSIGLELSLERVRRLWRLIVLGGGAQVVATVLVPLVVHPSLPLVGGESSRVDGELGLDGLERSCTLEQ